MHCKYRNAANTTVVTVVNSVLGLKANPCKDFRYIHSEFSLSLSSAGD